MDVPFLSAAATVLESFIELAYRYVAQAHSCGCLTPDLMNDCLGLNKERLPELTVRVGSATARFQFTRPI